MSTAVRFRYTGEEAYTRGQYGELVDYVYKLEDANGIIRPHPQGDLMGVWDSAFGWQVWGSWEFLADLAGPPAESD